MAQAFNRRLNRDTGIAGRWAAQHADVRTLGDLLAFIACAACVVAMAWMAFHPRALFNIVFGG